MLRLHSLVFFFALAGMCHAQTGGKISNALDSESTGVFGFPDHLLNSDGGAPRLFRFDEMNGIQLPTRLGYFEKKYDTEEHRQLMRSRTAERLAVREAFKTAKSIGLEGQWYVVSSKKDGPFSRAKIGQEPSDVITIASPDATGLPVG